MGMFTDILANAVSIDTSDPIEGPDRHAVLELERHRDVVLDADIGTDYAEANEVQSLAATDRTGGNFTLTFLLASGETFTTGNILFSSTAGTIETAIDSAATTASVVGWTNGDITAAGGAINSAPVTLTYDGTSVAALNHSVVVVNDVDLSGGSVDPVASTTTNGQADRNALGILAFLGEFTGTPPAFGDGTAGSWVVGDPARANRPSKSLVNALIREASHQEGVDYATILADIIV